MKKSYLFGMFALAAMTMVGCSNDEVVNDYSQDNAIEFGTYVGRDAQSRASVYNEKSMAETGFGVYAYYSQGKYDASDPAKFKANFMNNQKVETTYSAEDDATKTDYVWTYTPVKYWPNNANDYVSFIAYAPYSSTEKNYGITFGNQAPATLNFEVKNTPKEQTDLVWNNSNTLNLQKQGIKEKVVFNFAHALSRIGFNINLAVDELQKGLGELAAGTTIYVDKIELSSNFAKKATLDLTKTTATWALAQEENNWQGFVLDYVYSNGAVDETATELQNYIFTAPTAEEDEEDEDGEATEETKGKEDLPLNKTDSYLMIIPNKTTFTLTVTYRVFTADDKLTETVAEQPNVKGSLVTNVIPVDLTVDFKAGQAYAFNIILGMTSVKIDVNVAEWTETSEDYWFTENTDNTSNPEGGNNSEPEEGGDDTTGNDSTNDNPTGGEEEGNEGETPQA